MSKIVSIKVVEKEDGFRVMTEKMTASGKKQVVFYRENGKNKVFKDDVEAECKKQELLEKANGKNKNNKSKAFKNKSSTLSLKSKTLSLSSA